MDYEVGRLGRVVVARGLDGEDIYAQIESIATRENIHAAAVVIVGGMRSGKVVVGPKDPEGPIVPQFAEFNDAREIVGAGTIFCAGDAPKLHLHAAIGRGSEAIVGCPRGGATVFCVLEVILFEITGTKARREIDPQMGLSLLTLGRAGGPAGGSKLH